MAIADLLLPEFDREIATTRAMLERVRPEHIDWRPHPKSTPLGKLALHLANLPTWTETSLRLTEFDLNPPGGMEWPNPTFTTTEALVEDLDRNAAAARATIAATSDEDMLADWTLLHGGTPVFTMPRLQVLRAWVTNHIVHHRAQLGVYLRMNDVALPSSYGPTADDAA